ncbi:hypothetical protein LS68_006485 [Helicobacter sp. MIT 05-5293]|uniref:hypothetical protein n=1 Tax=Helicobacter sp. MIT 05-5293 TaxID=1548149 RepID=UPI00051CF4D6|nr:hypothetical protein [Helicobacter sp. MIT 05-5293]TLD80403.1 hypothetical protein LS68_006485 [Helicobacter sp. MIT 05-5293]
MIDTAVQNTPIMNPKDSVIGDKKSVLSKDQDSRFENLLSEEAHKSKALNDEKSSNTLPTLSKESEKTSKTSSLSSTPFEVKDTSSKDSRIGLQDKIAKASQENLKAEENPLLQALASASLGKTENAQKGGVAKDTSPLPASAARTPVIQSMPSPVAAQKIETEGEKTLADVQSLAQAKGLNPTKITAQGLPETTKNPVIQTLLAQEEAQQSAPVQKPRTIPASAKEAINYEYENNTDRIAIVQRGVKKPKNITSKISNVYPEKKSDNDTADAKVSLKDRPPIG